jgi:hypothetical protein
MPQSNDQMIQAARQARRKQIEADRAAREQTSVTASPTDGGQSRPPETGTATVTAGPSADVVAVPVRPRRFHGSVTLDATVSQRHSDKRFLLQSGRGDKPHASRTVVWFGMLRGSISFSRDCISQSSDILSRREFHVRRRFPCPLTMPEHAVRPPLPTSTTFR